MPAEINRLRFTSSKQASKQTNKQTNKTSGKQHKVKIDCKTETCKHMAEMLKKQKQAQTKRDKTETIIDRKQQHKTK